jgi:head-tail adaptor
MHIGKLDRPILIETKTEVLDTDYGTGTGTFTYGEFFTGFASVRDVLAGSKEASNQEVRLTKRPVKVVMRYVEGITAGMRVTLQDRDRVLEIVTPPAELGRKEGLEFICEEFSS